MTSDSLQPEFADTTTNPNKIADAVSRQPRLLPEILGGLGAEKAGVKYGCLKVLRILSEKRPALLYPHFDRFVALLESDNNILRWGAIIVIGNLAVVDSGNKIDALLDRYLAPIAGPVLITAANTIAGASAVALAKPLLADRIAAVLLQVESAEYQTPECRNVALGHVLKAFDTLFDKIEDQEAVAEFVARQLENERNAVARKARSFLRKHATPSRSGTLDLPKPGRSDPRRGRPA